MSLSGYFNDLLTGNPTGTADSQAAAIASQQAALTTQAKNNLAAGNITPDQYATLINSPALTQSDAPNTLGDTFSILGAAASTLPSSLANPVQTFNNGLAAEGSVLGGAAGSLLTGAKNAVGSFLGKIPWWFYLLAALGVFLWLGGGGFLERKARKKLNS